MTTTKVTLPTSEVRPVRETRGDLAVLRDDVDDSLLDVVHLRADRALADDVLAGQEHLVLQLRHDLRHERRVGVGEERHGRDEGATVVVDDVLGGGDGQ